MEKEPFDWSTLTEQDRFKRSRKWFAGFLQFKGRAVVKIAKSSGKAHLHITLVDNSVATITWKKGNLFLIHIGREKISYKGKSLLTQIEALRCLEEREDLFKKFPGLRK